MASRKAPGKKTARTEAPIAATAMTSPYNIMIPLMFAENVWVIHPATRKSHQVATKSEKFLDLMKELYDLGVGPRLEREFAEFTQYDPRWADVSAVVRKHVNGETDGTDEAVDTVETDEKNPG